MSGSLLASGIPASALVSWAPVNPAAPPAVSSVPSVNGVHDLASKFAKPGVDPAGQSEAPTATSWPAAAAETVDVADAGARSKTAKATPIWAGEVAGSAGPRTVDIRTLGTDTPKVLGLKGMVFTVAAGSVGSGPVQIGVDYASFAQVYGGNYGSRLRLAQLPACALTTPEVAACQKATPVASTNNTDARTVSAKVELTGTGRTSGLRSASESSLMATPMVFTVQSDSGGQGSGAGTYGATELKPAGTWTGGGSTGAFNYSVDITMPPAASTLVPKLAVSYNSQGVDGQTSSTQAQSSWVGSGWSTPKSYLEQSFLSCSESPGGSPSPVSTFDMCYNGPMLTLSLNGSSTPLIWDSTKQTWRSKDDTGAVITQVVNSGNGSGTYNTDYWTVTTRDGTVYYFGRNQLPGWSAGKPTTSSVDYEPVYSPHSGGPCYNISGAGFHNSVCTMAYKWNLDYVKDIRGNSMAYYYQQDFNYYGQNKGAIKAKYVRDSHLDHMDYGFRDGNAYATVPNKLQLTTGDRCLTGPCQPLNDSTKANWVDTPYDLICAEAASSCTGWSPAYFSTVRLTAVTTKQYSTASSSYANVDSWALSHTFPPSGDGMSPALWLSSITRTGYAGVGPALTSPPVQFGGIALQNRVDTVTDGLPAFNKYRLSTVTTEAGSVITAFYGRPDVCTAPVTLDPATNSKSCYPVRWTPPGYSQAITDWFNKYVVTGVIATDPTGGSAPLTTSYVYSGGVAWHYDDNELVQAKYRSYGQYRGYGKVQTLVGDGVNDRQTLSESTYYRGMSKNNSTTVVNVTDSQGGSHEDLDRLAGKELETTAYLGNGGPADHSTITSYWISDPLASRARAGLPDLTSVWVAPVQTFTRQALTSTATTTWRYTEMDNTFDAVTTSPTFGLLQRSYSHTVPADPNYDRCTSRTYAAVNTAKNLVGFVNEEETVSVKCGGFAQGAPASVPAGYNTLTAPTAARPSQVVSNTRTFFDDATWSTTFPQAAPPSIGDVTMTRKAVDHTAGAYVFQTIGRSKFDAYGRAVETYDGNGNKSANTYAMNAVGLTTGLTVVNAFNQSGSTVGDPRRGLTSTKTDANGVLSSLQYDTLGRLSGVWLNSRPTSSPANQTFTYVVSNSGVSSVTAKKLNESLGYQTSVTLYDALMRERQTQAITPNSGRMVSDTFYDSRGLVRAKHNGWWDPATLPAASIVTATDLGAQVPNQHFFTYDGLGRVVQDNAAKNGVTRSTTITVHNGDRVTSVAPTGGITQTALTDPLGRNVELDQYSLQPTVVIPTDTFTGIFRITGGTKVATTYGYDSHGQKNRVTDKSGAVWTTVFNLLGQATSQTDPDAGTTTNIKYDGNGNQVESTSALTKTISSTYDALNRKTGVYLSTVANQSAANRTSKWVYDNSDNAAPGMTNPVGHQTSSTAYWAGAAYTKQEKGFDVFGNSLGQTVTIPAAEGAILGTSYTINHTFSTNLGLPLQDKYPLKFGLPLETVNYGYGGVLDLQQTVGGLAGYAAGTAYDAYGRVNQQSIGSSPNLGYLTYTYDPHDGQLTNRLLTRALTTPYTVDEQAYTYDLSGNTLKQVSTRLGSAATSETQCFGYDDINRLTEAWTAIDGCAVKPTPVSYGMVGDNLGASSAYWTTWTVDDLGNRKKQVKHNLTGGADTTTDYTYNGNGTNQPHTLTSATGGAAYQYDAAGNMTGRNAGQGSQTLSWDDAGRLTSVTGSTGGPTNFIYDADGNLLLQKDPGFTTLYLPGEQVTLNTSSNTTTGVRFYLLPDGTKAMRTGSGANYKFEIGDHHGTGDLLLDNTAQNPTWRQFTVYGESRGPAATWVGNRGFLGKPVAASTGLTVVGARAYDPAMGRFISVDPEFHDDQPQSLNGYAYANSNPVTNSDPTGRELDDVRNGTTTKAEIEAVKNGTYVPRCRWNCEEGNGNVTHHDLYELNRVRNDQAKWRATLAEQQRKHVDEEIAANKREEAYLKQRAAEAARARAEEAKRAEEESKSWWQKAGDWVSEPTNWAVMLSVASLAVSFCPLPQCTLVAAGLGVVSAAIYYATGNTEMGNLQLAATMVGVIPGIGGVMSMMERTPLIAAEVTLISTVKVAPAAAAATSRSWAVAAAFEKTQKVAHAVQGGVTSYGVGAAFCGPNPVSTCTGN